MHRKVLRWIARHRRLTVCGLLTFLLLLVDVIAYNHARSMTHFSPVGVRTPDPERLPFWDKGKVLIWGVSLPRPINQTTPQAVGLIAETRHIPSTHGIDLELWEIPHPRPKATVLMAHGYASSKGSLLREAKAFHEMGFATCHLDFRGSGGSSGSDTTIGVYEADDLASVVEHIRLGNPDGPLILYGQSMGSVAILRAIALKDVQPSAIIIECPFDRLVSTVANRFSAMGLPAFPGTELLVFWGGVRQGFNGFSHNPVDYAKTVRCPVLLLHGAKDTRVTREQATSVFDALAGVKRLELFEGAGHEPYIGVDEGRWKRLISGFLSEQGGLGQIGSR